MSSLAERLERAFDTERHSYAALARAAKVKAPSVSDWFSGKTKSLKAEPLVRAAMYLQVSPLWLAAGEGPMRLRDDETAPTSALTVVPAMLPTGEVAAAYKSTNGRWPLPGVSEQEFFELLTPEMRAEIVGYVRGLLLSINRSQFGNEISVRR